VQRRRRKRRNRGGPAMASRRCCWRLLTREHLGRWSAFRLLLLCVFSSTLFSFVSIFFCVSSSPWFCLLLLLSSSISNGGGCCWWRCWWWRSCRGSEVVATSVAVFLLFHSVAAGEEDGERLMVALLEVHYKISQFYRRTYSVDV